MITHTIGTCSECKEGHSLINGVCYNCRHQAKDVTTVSEFLERYYKPERYHGRGEEYAQALLQSHTEYRELWGYDFISHHDSVTGTVVLFK